MNTLRTQAKIPHVLIDKEMAMQTIEAPVVPIGKVKSFGLFGPKYEVGQPTRRLDDGDWMVEVTMVESGEKAEYRLTRLADDPEAR
jgi:hypothetical protein